MQTNQISNLSMNNFNFNFKTSSGDNISLSMYDNKSMDLKSSKNTNSQTTELTLTHAYGYSFKYEGNGLDQNDIKEINEALKEIKPTLDKFLQNIKDGEKFTNANYTNLANEIKNMLPEIKNENHKNMISNNVLNLFDDLLKQNRADENMLKNANKLFENLLKRFDSFSLYV